MAITVTTDFQSIQERHIDPYSAVDSDNTSQILKALCKESCVSCGFDYTLLENDTSDPADGVADGVVISLSPGTAVKDYIAVTFSQTVYLNLFNIGDSIEGGDYKYVVLEYVYQKSINPPYAQLKVIDQSSFDQDKHLVLYKIRFDYDAGTDPVDTSKIKVYDLRFVNANNKFKYSTYVYVGTSNSGYVTLNSAFPLEFMQIADKTIGDYRVYTNEYVDDEGKVMITVGSAFAGDNMVLTALDFATTSYASDQFCVCTDPFTKTFSHGLNNTYNIVAQFLYDETLEKWSMVLPETIHFTNENSLYIKDSGSVTGKYSKVKIYVPDYTENFTPSSGNDTVTVTHDLLVQYPVVEVVDLTTNEIIIPETIKFIDHNSLQVKFGSSVFGNAVKIMVKKGNEYCFVPSDQREFTICHNLKEQYLDWVQTVCVDTSYQEQLEYVQFVDENKAKIKYGDGVEGWYYVSMGVMETDRGCV